MSQVYEREGSLSPTLMLYNPIRFMRLASLQVECPAVTPEVVLQASGHVERFTDLMVTDMKTGDCHRADHLLEHSLEALLEDPKKPPSAEEKKASYHSSCW